MTVVRVVLILLLAGISLFAETFKLFMRDGQYHLVREYQVQGDRVRYFSTERGDWEEIPTALLDLKKTEDERKRVVQALEENTKAQDEEEKAERAQAAELARIPMNAGAYLVEGDQIKTLEPAESSIVSNKKRSVLKAVTPIPIVAGKAEVQINGEHAKVIVNQSRPEFYLRLSTDQRFGIIQLTPKKGIRVVETLSIMPVVNEPVEEQKQIETFRQQLSDRLFKIWPSKPLEPGEYAVVEYTEGKVNLQVWDFAYRPGAAAVEPK